MKNNNGLNSLKMAKLLFAFLLIILPFQIGDLISSPHIFASGKFMVNDVFKLHLQDLLICFTILFLGFAGFKNEWDFKLSKILQPIGKWLLLMIVLFLFLAIFHDSGFIFGLFRYGLLFAFFYIVGSGLFEKEKIIKYLVIGLLLQFLIASYQAVFQTSLGLYFIGEPIVSVNNLGLASVQIMGNKFIRPYGTLAHANILGGFFLIGFILLKDQIKKMSGVFLSKIALLLMALGMFITLSRQTILALIIVFLVDILISRNRKVGYWIITIILILVGIGLIGGRFYFEFANNDSLPDALTERLLYLKASIFIIWDNLFLGIGEGNFVNLLQEYTNQKLAPWQLQPVHNVFVLWFVEYGFLIGTIAIYLWIKLFKTAYSKVKSGYPLALNLVLGSTIIMLFDHYFITNYQGQLLFFFILGITVHAFKNDALPAKKS